MLIKYFAEKSTKTINAIQYNIFNIIFTVDIVWIL